MLKNLDNLYGTLNKRGFLLLIAAQAISLQATWIQGTAQRWVVLELSDSTFYVGILGAISGLPVLLFSVMGGYLSDKFNLFSVLFFAHSIIALQGIALGYLIDSHQLTLNILLFMAFILGTGMAFEVPSRQSLIFSLVGREYITNALAMHSVAFNLARFIGPGIAGYLMAQGEAGSCFYVKGASALLVIYVLFVIMKRDYAKLKSKERRRGDSRGYSFKEGIYWAKGEPLIGEVLLTILVFGIVLLPYSILLPSFGRDYLLLGPREYGILCSSNGLGALFAATFVAMFGTRKNRLLWWRLSIVAFPCSMALIGITNSFLTASLTLFICGFSMVFCATSAISLIQLHAKDSIRGQLMGLFTTCFMGFFPVGSLIIGAMGERLSINITFMLQGAIALFAAVIIHTGIKKKAGQ